MSLQPKVSPRKDTNTKSKKKGGTVQSLTELAKNQQIHSSNGDGKDTISILPKKKSRKTQTAPRVVKIVQTCPKF